MLRFAAMRDTQPSRRQFLASGAVAAAATAVDAQGRQPVVAVDPAQPAARRLERADPRPDGHGLRSARARDSSRPRRRTSS